MSASFTFDLSDDACCERWVESPYFQYFCGETFFEHKLPFDRSSMTRWRQRMGEEKLKSLLQESLAVAIETKALSPADVTEVILDTTVMPKAVMFPTDAKLMNRAREKLVRLAKAHGLELRQAYTRVGKYALIKHQRYAHAKQFKRASKMKRKYDQRQRDFAGAFKQPLWRAVMTQRPRDPARKVYSLHAPEVECIGKGKAHMPYEFGVKVSVATTLKHAKGGQFRAACHGAAGQPL